MLTKKDKAIAAKQTQTQIISAIAEETGYRKKDVQGVLECLSSIAQRHIMKRGSGEFKIPYMGLKINRKDKPATKKRLGRNPATGEEIVIPAKPKRQVIKAVPLKQLKEVV
jgi:nucleoid DNA-binding protein